MFAVEVELSGVAAWSTDRITAVVAGLQADAVDAVADRLHTVIQGNMRATFRNATGYYYSRVVNERREATDRVVTDNGVIYGPWLEGVGRRNQITRFKGYANFRRGMQQVGRQVPAIAEPVVQASLARRLP